MASSYDYYGQNAQQTRQQTQQPSPYATMQPSSAGSPASSYSSQGGAAAGSWGTQAPASQAHPSVNYNYGQPAQQSRTQQPSSGGWPWPTQSPQSYQAPVQQPPVRYPNTGIVSPAQQQQQQAFTYQNPNNAPQGQQPQTQQGAGAMSYQQWLDYLLQTYNPQGSQQPGGQQTGGVNPFPGGQPPPQQADFDGYQPPRLTQAPLGPAMPGWDAGKWNDPNHQSPKYVVGRILQGIPARTDQMDIAVARLAAAYPGAKRVGAGDVAIPGVGTIDILQAAGSGGRAWQWLDGSQGGGSSAATNTGVTGNGGGSMDIYTQLLKALTQQQAQPVQQAKAVDYTKDPQYLALIQQAQTQLAEARAKNTGTANQPAFHY